MAFVTALFQTESSPKVARPLSSGVGLLAVIPSVLYGKWGRLSSLR
ncbi:MAG: hypothetical protein MJ051_04565 [Akkermansia sp.]|nr:hypothetical protein [Akkermansia sp.]